MCYLRLRWRSGVNICAGERYRRSVYRIYDNEITIVQVRKQRLTVQIAHTCNICSRHTQKILKFMMLVGDPDTDWGDSHRVCFCRLQTKWSRRTEVALTDSSPRRLLIKCTNNLDRLNNSVSFMHSADCHLITAQTYKVAFCQWFDNLVLPLCRRLLKVSLKTLFVLRWPCELVA